MIKLMRFRKWFFVASILVILPGLFVLLSSGLKLGIDFTGGTLLEYRFEKELNRSEIEAYGVVVPEGNNTYLIRMKPLEGEDLAKLRGEFEEKFGNFEVRREERVGPVIGEELKQKALIALLLSCLMIVLYITYAFRAVPKPASSLRFGVAAIAALLHDVLLVLGLFAIFGKLFHVEVDILFVTALLTVIGFSVHDTIVVFDRIRENLPKYLSSKFEEVCDISITQTLARSLNTSLTVIFVLSALLLFGGNTIRWFVTALLVGIVSGTYSSIFNATALLVWWEERNRG